MLSSLFLANIRILLCSFFSFLVMLSNFSIIPTVREIKAKVSLAIPTGAQTTLGKEIIDTPPVVGVKTIKSLSM